MSQSQYSLAWESFKTNICSGFSALQQNGEFVDMTLAADGHFVKVHQVLVALSSTYLKNLISSAPCQHPVIFLNNVSHKVLCYLLEYIYTGEVLVPSEYLPSFAEAAKALHIKGLESVCNMDFSTSRSNTVIPIENIEVSHVSQTLKRKSNIDTEQKLLQLLDLHPVMTSFISIQMNLLLNARKVFIKPEGAHMSVNQSLETDNDNHDYGNDFMESGAQHSDDEFKHDDSNQAVDVDQVKANPSNLLFTVSIRGSLQAILNRYIYNLNSTTSRTGVRRWRCVDYRNNKCNAFVVTKGNVVVNRANLHNHPFHDKKILSKIEKKAVFSALDDVEAYREKEKTMDDEVTVEEDSYVEHTNYKDDDKSG